MHKKQLLVLCFIILQLFLSSCTSKGYDYLQVHVIDVGQGDSSLIITPSKKTILVDSGEEEYFRNVMQVLKKNNVKKIDYLIATHFDGDHIGSMDKIIKNFQVEKIYTTPDKNFNTDFLEIVKESSLKNKKTIPLISDDSLSIDKNISINILSPIRMTDDTNKNSICFLLSYKKHSLLFTGDIDSDVEKEILKKYNLPKCSFLKVSHHGSKTASSDIFISTIKPKIASISCEYKNRYGHPHENTLNTLKKYNSKILRTDKNSSMTFLFDDKEIYMQKKYIYN
ncbi:ComEC/Rec2 family competence protein [Peptostreptococcus faecalis]|uniref:ComEC/Rec2 family competence protein n=1 Tax=Peptostreptococcus faecalis TaxID=2045015 RepID=UPI000C7C4A9F|nr:ComEC/Rec2 family competence protein [Peptostreptococcus faecalis]